VPVNADGTISTTLEARYMLNPFGAEPFSCAEPGGCTVVANMQFSGIPSVAAPPLTFKPIGTASSGTLQGSPATVTAGQDVQVSGSGWASNATVLVSLCSSVVTGRAPPCLSAAAVFADSQGAFSTSVTARGDWENQGSFTDCAAAPGTCFIRAHDSRDARVHRDLPLTMTKPPVQRGNAVLDLHSPLVDALTVRVQGSGWEPGRSLQVMQCTDSTFSFCRLLRSSVTVRADGTFRAYGQLLEFFTRFVIDTNESGYCALTPGACTLVVGDTESLAATAVRIPLTFVQGEQVDVTSHYEAKWTELLQQGSTASGHSVAELQRTGSAVLFYVLGLAGVSGTAMPRAGTIAHTTRYTLEQYRRWSRQASFHDYTLVEAQKDGALFWSWLLAGRPPLP
jgi:hypothetical protein